MKRIFLLLSTLLFAIAGYGQSNGTFNKVRAKQLQAYPTPGELIIIHDGDQDSEIFINSNAADSSLLTWMYHRLDSADLDAGEIDGVVIGANEAAAGSFTTIDADGGTIDGTVIGGNSAAAGSFSTANIDGGTIDGTVIGGSTPAAADFTNVTATDLNGVVITDGGAANRYLNEQGDYIIVEGAVSFGLESEIPTVNSSADGYDYTANLKYDSGILKVQSKGMIIGSTAGETWETQTSAADNSWRSVIQTSTGRLVAVASSGTGNRVMTSDNDGVTWTTQTSAADNSWVSVIQTNTGRLVAVAFSGLSNRVMTSDNDGVTWTTQTSAADNSWTSVIQTNTGRLVAVAITGSSNRVMTSDDDGETWTTQTSAADNQWNSVIQTNTGRLVAVSSTGTGDRVMTSDDDGETWTTQTSAADNGWTSVIQTNTGRLVAVAFSGSSNRVMTSDNDGVTWTTQTSAADNLWNSVTQTSTGRLVAVASDGTGNRVMTSDNDGVTWTTQTSAANNSWTSVIQTNTGRLVAVSSTGTGDRVMTSDNDLSAGVTGGGLNLSGSINSPNSLVLSTGDTQAMTIDDSQVVTIGANDLGSDHLHGTNKLIISDGDDSGISIVSTDAGTYGSYIALRQVDGTTHENTWSIIRETNGDGSGNGNLKMDYNDSNSDPTAGTTYFSLNESGGSLNLSGYAGTGTQDAQFTSTGTLTRITSDEKTKKDIEPLKVGLDYVLAAAKATIEFNYIDSTMNADGYHHWGFGARAAQKEYGNSPAFRPYKGIYSWDSKQMIAPAYNAISELHETNKIMTSWIAGLLIFIFMQTFAMILVGRHYLIKIRNNE